MRLEQQLTLVILTVFILLGGFLIGRGITGMVTYEPLVGELCSAKSDCASSNACCLFYESDYGVCASPSNCADILYITSEKPPKDFLVEQPELIVESRLEAITGITIAALVLVILYLSIKINRLKKKLKEDEAIVKKDAKKKHSKKVKA